VISLTVQMKVPDDGEGYEARGSLNLRRKLKAIVTIMFADDNYGNLMQVMDPDMNHTAGAGIYYHADCEICASERFADI